MSYRVGLPKHKKPANRTMQKTSTPSRYFMENGTTFNLAIPCWYREIYTPIRARHHCHHWHDHVGQPSPNHPDHVCQVHDFASECHHHDWPYHKGEHFQHGRPHHHHHHDHCHRHYLDMAKLFPIHLTEEGYSKVIVIFDKEIEGLEAIGYISDVDDWVIRIDITAYVEEAFDKPIDVRFIVKVSDAGGKMVDVASRGILRIEPAPLEA